MDIKQQYLDFLYSHIEWEHIEQDAEDTYGTSELEALDVEQLRKLSETYGFDDNDFQSQIEEDLREEREQQDFKNGMQ